MFSDSKEKKKKMHRNSDEVYRPTIARSYSYHNKQLTSKGEKKEGEEKEKEWDTGKGHFQEAGRPPKGAVCGVGLICSQTYEVNSGR